MFVNCRRALVDYRRLYEQTSVPVAPSIPRTSDSGTIDELEDCITRFKLQAGEKAETKGSNLIDFILL